MTINEQFRARHLPRCNLCGLPLDHDAPSGNHRECEDLENGPAYEMPVPPENRRIYCPTCGEIGATLCPHGYSDLA